MLCLPAASLFLFPNGLFFIPVVILVFPGFFDLRLHFKEPGFFMAAAAEKYDFCCC